MNIIVAGCGKIGMSIVSTLVSEGHDVTAIDKSSQKVGELTNIYDAIGVCGNAADIETLEEAGAAQAELFISVTDSDELNMLACFLAKRLGASHTIARIRNPEYNEKSLNYIRSELGISIPLNPELLMAQELYNILRLPSAFKVDYFSKRNVEMIEMRLKPDSPLCGKRLTRLREKSKLSFLVNAVLREGEVVIPDGSFELRAGDVISIAANPSDMHKLLRSFGLLKRKSRNIMIFGGSKTAFYLSKMLLASGCDVRIVEKSLERCEALSQSLPDAVLIHGDGLERELLFEEGLRSVDSFVALSSSDEENILLSIFASGQSVPKVIAKVNHDDMVTMAENLGVDTIVSTKSVTSDVVLRYTRALLNTRGSSIETLYKIMDGKAEAIEFSVCNGSPVAGVPIKELKIKQGVLITSIVRARMKAIIPTGDDVINEGDRVIIVAAKHRLGELEDILK